jgi:6,7-dimethyl-8-ribityllumazine synthase
MPMAGISDVRVIEGDLDASGMKVAIVVGRFNAFITERLLEGAVDALVRHGADAKDITVVRVPGSFEIPAVARQVVATGQHDAVVGLGCLMRGDTLHFDLIAGEVTKGLAALAQVADIPVTFGVLTTDSLEQAVHRAGAKHGNKGAEAVMAAVELVSLSRALAPAKPRRPGGRKKTSRK